jgi:hypothetical protein
VTRRVAGNESAGVKEHEASAKLPFGTRNRSIATQYELPARARDLAVYNVALTRNSGASRVLRGAHGVHRGRVGKLARGSEFRAIRHTALYAIYPLTHY